MKKTLLCCLGAALLLLTLFSAALAEAPTVTLTADKDEYLINEQIILTITAPGMKQYRLYHDNGNRDSGSMPYDGKLTHYSSNYGLGQHTIYMEGSFDNGATWVRSNDVTFTVTKLGDATFEAAFEKTIIAQGKDMVITLGERAHVEQFYLSWESGYNPNELKFDADAQEIRVSTLSMAPGRYDVFLGVYAEAGYTRPDSVYVQINITGSDAIEEGKVYIQGPETVNAGEETLFLIYCKNASSLYVSKDDQYGFVSYFDPGHTHLLWFSADDVGEHVINVQAKVGEDTFYGAYTFTVVCEQDLRMDALDLPETIIAGQPVTLTVRKPLDADYISVYVTGGDQNFVSEEELTEDYTIALTGEQTQDINSLGVNAMAWKKGRVLSSVYGYSWVDEVSDYVTLTADRQQCEEGETVTCTLSIRRALGGAEIVVGDQVFPVDESRLQDGEEINQAVTLDAPGTYSAFVRIRLRSGLEAESEPFTVYVGHSWGEPTYTWDGMRVTARAVCQNDPEHILEETVRAAVARIVSPTEDAAGAYDLSAEFANDAFAPQTLEGLEIPALGELNALTLPADLRELRTDAFAQTAAQAVIIPDGCMNVDVDAFSGCEGLIYVSLPAALEGIAGDIFAEYPDVILDYRRE